MQIEHFKLRFNEIVDNIENTNFGSINAEFKLVILIQEFILTNKINKEYISNIIEEEMKKDIDFEARIQVLGEISSNLQNAHKCKSIFDDYGQDYVLYLFRILNILILNDRLFNVCNE